MLNSSQYIKGFLFDILIKNLKIFIMSTRKEPIVKVSVGLSRGWHKRLCEVIRKQGKIRSATIIEILQNYTVEKENEQKHKINQEDIEQG